MLGALLLGELVVHVLHHVVVFGMHHEHPAAVLHLLHQVGEMAHADAALLGEVGGAYVGGENLEAGIACLHCFAHLGVNHVGLDFGEEHDVIAVVAIGIALPAAVALGDGGFDAAAGAHDGKVENRGGAAEEGCAAHLLRGSGLLAGHSHDGGGDVGVGFDASWDDHLAQGIEHLAYLCVQRPLLGHCHNLAALNADVPSTDAPRRYDHATPNHHVNHGASSCCLGLTQANIPHRRLLPTPAVLLAAFR